MDSRSSAAPLIGRERELGRLEAALDALDAGSAAFVSVEGEPGIGKTRLLAELRVRAERRGHTVLGGAAAEFERGLPFGVWADALDAYVMAQELDREPGWTPELGAELAHVLPSLPGAGGGTGAVADERYRAHRAVSRLLALLADDRPLLLVLDDLHWCDGASVELIAALIRRQPAAPVLLALGFRPGQAAEALTIACAAPPIVRLVLSELTRTEAVAMLDDHDPDAVAAIYSQGGGNPFYLEQLGRSSDGFGSAAPSITGVPAAVAGSISGEIASLSPASRSFLDAAAVAGEPFEPDVAAAIGELSDPEGLSALDDLLDLDLVRPTALPRRFSFRHPLVRRTVYESTKGGWRLAAHARAAAVLAERGADPSERANHVERYAARGDEEAIALLLDAGRSAASRAPAAAARWFEAALRLLPSGDRERQVEVRMALASALRAIGDLERCRTAVLETIELLPPDAADRRVELTTLCAAVEHWMGRHDEAHRRLMRAAEDLGDGDRAAAASVELELAMDGLYGVDFEQALTRGERAVATAADHDDPLLLAAACSVLALVESSAGRMEPAREHRDRAAELIDDLSDDEVARRLEALFYLGWAESHLDLFAESIAHAERGVEIARATGQGRLLGPMMMVPCYAFEMQGRLGEALAICEAATEMARLSGNAFGLYWALYELGWVHYYAGDLDAATAAAEESLSVDDRLLGGTMPVLGGGPGWLLGCVQLATGRPGPALEMTRGIAATGFQVAAQRCFDHEIMALAEIELGNVEAARACADEALDHAARLGTRLSATVAGRSHAAVLMAEGDARGAADAAAVAVAAATEIGAGLQGAFARSLQGRALAAAGERDAAVAALRQAEQELDASGSVRERDLARRELRKLGARAEPRGKATAEDAGLESLTRREREIADLVTDRLTNAEIAERLFLSKKTIETHIRNLFIKLGASSRVEVARMVERDRREQDAAA